jgi:hypothetical protein
VVNTVNVPKWNPGFEKGCRKGRWLFDVSVQLECKERTAKFNIRKDRLRCEQRTNFLLSSEHAYPMNHQARPAIDTGSVAHHDNSGERTQ